MNIIKIKDYPEVLSDVKGYGYAAVPFLFGHKLDKLMLTKRDLNGRSLPFVYLFSKDTMRIEKISEKPILSLGEIGTFDEDGVMPVCSILVANRIYLYYIGWNQARSVPFRNSIGLAISEDNGSSFYKPFRGPILDRSIFDPCFVASCCVIFDEGIYKMWYLSCDSWNKENDLINHKYNIKYATSIDGINWHRDGLIAIDYVYENEYAISVPRVIKENGGYKMWYSYRGHNSINTYRIGYAESIEGLIWERKDYLVKMELSPNGFDNEMLCYPYLFDHNGVRFMFYNGNGYGETGFGIARIS